MKKHKILLCLLLLVFTAIAQNKNYTYNKLMIKAEICAKYKKYDKAIQLFEEARKYKPDNWFFYATIADFYANFETKYDSAFVNFEKSILYGLDANSVDFYEHPHKNEFKSFYPEINDSSTIGSSPKWNHFIKRLHIAQKTYYCNTANINLSLKLRELIGAEQSIRNLEERFISEKQCDADKILISSWIDSLNLIELVDIIKRNGFPKYPEISTIDEFEILCLHNSMYDSPNAKLMMDSLKKNVLENNFSYLEYMHIIDRELTWKEKKKQKFGWFYDFQTNEIDPVEDIEHIDKIREDYNIPSLYEQCLFYNLKIPKGYPIPKKLQEEYSTIIK